MLGNVAHVGDRAIKLTFALCGSVVGLAEGILAALAILLFPSLRARVENNNLKIAAPILHQKPVAPSSTPTMNNAYDSVSSIVESATLKEAPNMVIAPSTAPHTPQADFSTPVKSAKKLSFAQTPPQLQLAPAPQIVAVATDAPEATFVKEVTSSTAAPPSPSLVDLSPHKTAKAKMERVFSKKKRQAYKELKTAVKQGLASPIQNK